MPEQDDQRTETRSELPPPDLFFPMLFPLAFRFKICEIFPRPFLSLLLLSSLSHLSSLCFHSKFLCCSLSHACVFFFVCFFYRLALPCLISARPICSLTMDHSPFLLKVTALLFTLPDAESLSGKLLSPV